MSKVKTSRTAFVVLGNHLFPFSHVRPYRKCRFFMAEDVGLCTIVRHHRQKIAMFLAAMRAYRDELRRHKCRVHYEALQSEPVPDRNETYEIKLERFLAGNDIDQLVLWEVEDKFFEKRIIAFAREHELNLTFLPSPMFVTPREQSAAWLDDHRPHMAAFYRWQRERLGVLLNADGSPLGGRWSFDADNRRPLPKSQTIPSTSWAQPTQRVQDVIPVVSEWFADHPGELSEDQWWLPTTRHQALAWLREFLEERFDLFGPYEDALSTRDPFLFHSILSPTLNLGLLTPDEVVDRALRVADENGVRINSLEGFVRQIIGWREFVRGVYQRYSEEQEQANFFEHRRRLTAAWYTGSTGLLPLDDVIRKALRFGWAHHIERLMVAGNLMTLCEIEPREAFRWFMELFVDSADWVMVPNVYGMGTFADGGIFATKPYICGSNYIRKMSDYGMPAPNTDASWCDVMDGLYWRFIDRNRDFFRGQARMGQAVATLDRMSTDRRRQILAAAETFLERVTR